MNKGFWGKQKQFFVLAPMANVTDAAFRRIINTYGKPDVFWTEFVSVEGLLSRGREKLLPDLWFTPEEKPIVAQIFGGKPEQFYEIAPLLVKLGFDGVDINMGCPDSGVEKSGGGASLIKDPKRAQEIIKALQKGIADACLADPRWAGSTIPVSVKTRIGYNKNEMETWIPALLEKGIAALTVHLRTRKEMSDVPAHWELMPRIVELRNKYAPETVLLGNGDVKDLAEARQKVKETGCDGVMLGRAIFGNPWLFSEHIPSTEEKLRVAVEHTKLFEELYGSVIASEDEAIQSTISGLPRPQSDLAMTKRLGRIKPFDVMKKHFKAYVSSKGGSSLGGNGGTSGLKELRMQMMEAQTVEDVEGLVAEFLSKKS